MTAEHDPALTAHLAQVAAAREYEAHLASWPLVVDVMHDNPHDFVQELLHWGARRYTLGYHGMQNFEHGNYAVLLNKPYH